MVTLLRRCDVFDSAYRVRLRGCDPSDVAPFDAQLEDELVVEIDGCIKHHDFTAETTATGFLGEQYEWCVLGIAPGFFSLLLMRSKTPKRVARFARSHMLCDTEHETLRYLVSRHDVEDVARRRGETVEAVRESYAALVEKLEATDERELLEAAKSGKQRTKPAFAASLDGLLPPASQRSS